MAKTVILHVVNEDAIVADMEDLPDPSANYFVCTNIRKKDGKPVSYIERGVKQVLFPWNRVSFIEVMESQEEKRSVVDFYREG